jgi:Ribbon-helix-helix protein, copG family
MLQPTAPSNYSSGSEVMYAQGMKRLQIMIEEDLDAELERLAAAQGTSKAALIRRYVRERIQPLPPLSADPLAAMVGADAFEPAPVDEVVYR